MTLSVNKNIARGLNTLGYWVGTFFGITLDNNYPTGGYSFLPTLVKLGLIEYMAPFICPKTTDGSTAILAQYNYTTQKLQCYWLNGAASAQAVKLKITGGQAAGIGVQVTPDSNSGVLGKTTAGDITVATTLSGGSAAGTVLQEVDNGADLSGFSGRGLVFGKG